MTEPIDHAREAESYLLKLDDLDAAEAYVAAVAAQAHTGLAQLGPAREMVELQRRLLESMIPPAPSKAEQVKAAIQEAVALSRAMPGPVEEQVKPAVEEPELFGSIAQAWHPSEDPRGTPPDLWQMSPTNSQLPPVNGKHYWENRNGVIEVWSNLQHPEVLRVGIGEPDAYARGYEDGVDSNRPSPVDRSNIRSAISDALAAIIDREGRLVGVGYAHELADAVMKVMADEPATLRFCSLRRDCRMADGHQGACQP